MVILPFCIFFSHSENEVFGENAFLFGTFLVISDLRSAFLNIHNPMNLALKENRFKRGFKKLKEVNHLLLHFSYCVYELSFRASKMFINLLSEDYKA